MFLSIEKSYIVYTPCWICDVHSLLLHICTPIIIVVLSLWIAPHYIPLNIYFMCLVFLFFLLYFLGLFMRWANTFFSRSSPVLRQSFRFYTRFATAGREWFAPLSFFSFREGFCFLLCVVLFYAFLQKYKFKPMRFAWISFMKVLLVESIKN